ncbi:MAG: peptidoglycan-binding protein [Bacteroidota bacterium]|nr:peptidoglycan-binding protein [Bacteroidota bacterium]
MATTHIVKQGECLAGIAKKYGFYSWKIIYEYPENREFKNKRPNPNIIFPGDKIIIPDIKSKVENIETGKKIKIKLKIQHTYLRIILKDEGGNPLANVPYKLQVGNANFEGNTNDKGLLENKVPSNITEGKLTVIKQNVLGDNYTWMLKINSLDPIEEITGVQARLTNLGYRCGSIDGIIGPHTEAAIKIFQRKNGLTPNGQLNEETRSKLNEVYGC